MKKSMLLFCTLSLAIPVAVAQQAPIKAMRARFMWSYSRPTSPGASVLAR